MVRIHPSVPAVSASDATGDPAPASAAAPERADADAAPRWEPLSVLGHGGMGRVRLVHDRWLARDVAIKEPRSPHDAALLAREARTIAGLQHPGIVAVHDIHRGPDGAPSYVMPVVRGQSLAEHLAALPPGADRLSLLRPLLAACHAVAYAHSRGVVHRDLTAANVMLGEFGEVQVIDWGLALVPGDPSGPPPRAGTPGAMSPEQARGEPLDARTDVFALGLLLAAVAGPSPPAPLADILRKATAPARGARYADASALAADLAAFLDGRRVTAHTYTPGELFGRLVRAWRTPLLVAGVALAVLLAFAAFSYRRVAAERTLAEARLGHALLAQAHNAAREGRSGAAAVLAAHAHARAPSPEARGLLALDAALTPPTLLERHPLPCTPFDVSPAGRVLCLDADGVWLVDHGAPRRVTATPARHVAFLGGDAEVLVVGPEDARRYRVSDLAPVGPPHPLPDRHELSRSPTRTAALAWGAGPLLTLFAPGSARPLSPSPCAGANLDDAAVDASGTRAALICRDRTAVLIDPLGVARTLPLPASSDAASALDASSRSVTAAAFAGPDHLLLAEASGRVSLVPFAAPAHARTLSPPGAPVTWKLLASADGRLALFGRTDAPSLIFDLERGAPVVPLPRGLATDAFAFAPDAPALVVAGADLARWDLAPARPNALTFASGLADLSLAPSGAVAAVAHGAEVSRVSLAPLALLETHRWQDGFVKALAFAPDGDLFAVGFGDHALHHLPPGAPANRRTAALAGAGFRRVVPLGADRFHGLHYSDLLTWIRPGDPTLHPLGRGVTSLAASASGARLVLVLRDGTLRCAPGELATLDAAPPCGRTLTTAAAHALAPTAPRLYAAAPGHVAVIDLDAPAWGLAAPAPSPPRYEAPGADLVAIAIGEGWLAAGGLDGRVWLWRLGAPAAHAVARPHTQRVGRLAFTPGERTLVSAGWDGQLALLRPALSAPEPAAIEARWGLTLDQLLTPTAGGPP